MGYFDKIYLHEKKTGNLLDITRLDKEHYECFLETVVRIRDNYYREIERGATFDTGDRQLTIPDVTNRTLKDGRKQAYLQGYRKSAISIEGAYSDQTEIEAKKEFDNWHFNLYGW